MYEIDEERVDASRSELMAKLVMALGGRAADRLIFGEEMTGAVGDLQQATKLARQMVTQFGMSERLGPVAYRAGEDHVFLGKELHEARDFSDGTAKLIDEEVQRILREAEERAYRLLQDHRADLDRLAGALLEREELDRDDVAKLLGPRPSAARATDA
jgi:cell division protease FtsH